MKGTGLKLKGVGACFALALCVAFSFASAAEAKPVTEVDSRVSPALDWSKVRSVCPWPADLGGLPEIVSLSLPERIGYWVENALKANRNSRSYVVKSPDAVWKDVWFLKGPFTFGDPFASEETEKFFYDNLEGACGAVLRTRVTVRSERKWQEPRTEYYWTTRTVSGLRPGRRRGGMVWVDIEIPVRRQRVVPGYWYTVASARCGAELFVTENMSEPAASAIASGEDSGREGEKTIVTRLVKKTVEDAMAEMLKTD